MKKIFTIFYCVMIALVIAPSVRGEIIFTDKYLESRPEFISKYLTKDNAPQLMAYSWDYDSYQTGVYDISIYDENFDKVREVNIPSYPEVAATYKEWVGDSEKTHTQQEKPRPMAVDLYTDLDADMYGSAMLTQSIFNDDDLYEWIIPTYTVVPYNEVTDYSKIQGEKIVKTGFKVMTEGNSVIAEITYPDGYRGYHGDELSLNIAGEKKYLLADVHGDDYSAYIVYAISSENGSIRQVGEPIKSHVSPTAPRRGTPVSVDLGISNDRGCTVEMISADGSRVLSRNLRPGITDTEISTDNLTPGMYIVNVISGSSKHEATKIIVR